MARRSLHRFVKFLDPEKVYFLQSDVNLIIRKNKKLFYNLKRQNCSGLYFVYDLYKKRVLERTKFALAYLDDFQPDKSLSYILDTESRKRSRTSAEANRFMTRHLQYQVASVLMAEEDKDKALDHIRRMLQTERSRTVSWKPHLNKRERRRCRVQAKQKGFKVCKPAKWLARYLDAYAQALDSHSSYLDKDEMKEFKISMEWKLEGVGATLSSRLGYTVVEDLIEGGAAFRTGRLKVKDKILAVGQEEDSLINIFGADLQDVVSMIRGKKGAPVYLKILREHESKEEAGGGKAKPRREIFTVKIIRDTVSLKEKLASLTYVTKKPLNGALPSAKKKIALIHVPSFYGSARSGDISVSRDVKRLLQKAQAAKADAAVLDLSGNRGGPLEEAVNLAGFFFARGRIVKQSEKNMSYYRILSDRDKNIVYKGPLVVLVNRLSASASEIVAGALKDYNRAVIVGGDHTFGKGSVQSVEVLPFGIGAVKTTIGLYFIPGGRSTQKNGVDSHIALPSVFNLEDLGEKGLEDALPAQNITPFRSENKIIFSKKPSDNWKPLTEEIIERLKKFSAVRVSENKKFQDIQKRLAKIKAKAKAEKGKAVSIAELLTKDEEDEEREKKEKAAAEKRASSPAASRKAKKKKYLARPDVNEALNIAADLAALSVGKSAVSGLSPRRNRRKSLDSAPVRSARSGGDSLLDATERPPQNPH